MFWVDNVILDVPLPLSEEREILLDCKHSFVVELPGDVRFCTICGTFVADQLPGLMLRQWQELILKNLGL